MLKLNQIIAIVQGKKSRAIKLVTDIHQGWKGDRIVGISRVFKPLDDDGDSSIFPPENTPVQLKVVDALGGVYTELLDFFNVVATQEYSNTVAKGDIIVDGESILLGVPVSALLFIEKQLVDMRTLMANLPTLPTDRVWKEDSNKNCWVTEAEQTVKTKKVPKVIVKYEATKEHPAQTELVNIDEVIGHWATVHMSGAVPVSFRNKMIKRVEKLRDAVKIAREQANNTDVTTEENFGRSILGFVFKSE